MAGELKGRGSGLEAGSLMAVTGRSDSTTSAYRVAVKAFVAWAQESGRVLGVEALAEYVAELQGEGKSASVSNRALYAGKPAMLQAAERGGMSAYGTVESEASTVIYVPKEYQFAQGFEARFTSGEVAWDETNQLLHWKPKPAKQSSQIVLFPRGGFNKDALPIDSQRCIDQTTLSFSSS